MAAEHSEHAHSGKLYLLIWAVLLVLTVVSFLVSRIDLGNVGNMVLGLAIATVKATLVALYFMHLNEARFTTRLVTVSVVLTTGILLVLTASDLVFRPGYPVRGQVTGPGAGGPGALTEPHQQPH